MTGPEFRNYRSMIGWTQQQAADALSVSVKDIRRIERLQPTETQAKTIQLYRLGDWPGRASGRNVTA